jgi:hypothetical protein
MTVSQKVSSIDTAQVAGKVNQTLFEASAVIQMVSIPGQTSNMPFVMLFLISKV